MNSPPRTQPKIATHTPTPWFVSGVRFRMNGGEWQGINRYDEALKRDENVACVGYDSRTGLGMADAHFIVEACNSHASLKARIQELEEALRHLDSLLDFSDEDVDPVWTFEDTTSIQAAFARAHAALQPKEPK